MILSREAISLFRKMGLISIEPFDQKYLNPNSYDVSLGNWATDVIYKDDGTKPNFYPNMSFSSGAKKMDRFLFYEPGSRMQIPPHCTRLSHTVEIVGTKWCIVAEIRAKSTTRRSGITICDDAGFGDIGYNNVWTVELTSHVFHCPSLVVGEKFAQVVFFLATPTLKPYQGQYNQVEMPLAMIPKKYR